jgi:PAS domain S-box-containing protein
MEMENLQLFISLVEGTNDLIQSVDEEGKFEFVNRAWFETLGYETKELDSLTLNEILFPGYVKKHTLLISQVLKGEIVTDVEVTFVSKSGDLVHLEGNLFPRKEGSKILAATGFFRDVTDRKEAEEKLKEARARTEFFVDLMVHDIANINQEVLSLLELIIFHKDLPSELKTLVVEGLTEVERASDLISNVKKIISVYSKEPETKRWDLFKALTDAVQEVDSAFADRTLNLNTSLSSGKYSVLADEFLKDVFFSLFHNSMKYDTSKTVNVDVQVEELAHTPFLKIQVKDYGTGIPDLQKERIFARFSHRRESAEGLGLGLTLVKKILENYGAIIRVEDRVEGDHTKGTNFVILLRHHPATAEREDDSK